MARSKTISSFDQKTDPHLENQFEELKNLALGRIFHPVPQIWHYSPVQMLFTRHVQ